ncbi:unnamed protein product [Adineta steineri]|uniref:FG-GAP repeat protein n=2 Tax=Adineta steineri TaxID=433720 RepID=A0A814VQ02_9BILA|nr:unnamed protein product [Adineta steineri]
MSSEITTTNTPTAIDVMTHENDINVTNLLVLRINSIHESIGSAINDSSIKQINPDKKLTKPILACLLFALYTSYICLPTYKLTAEGVVGYNSRPHSIAIADFNQDNKLDIVVANSDKDNIGIFIQNSNGTFQNQITYSTNLKSSPHAVIVNDFNQDNFFDIVVANYGNNNIGIFLGEKNLTFQNMTTFSTGNSHPFYLNCGDFNNDNNLDIVSINYGTNSISIYFGYGNGNFSKEINYFLGYDSIPYSLFIADFNNDKFLDLAIANYGTNNIAILFGNASGIFSIPIIYSTYYGSQPSSITAADLNDDNILDLIVANSGTFNIGIFYGYKNGSFQQQQMYILDDTSRPQFVTIGDVNNDNQPDIIILDSTNGYVQVLSAFGNGSFNNLTTYYSEDDQLPFTAAIGDINNDNQSEIVIVSYEANVVVIYTGYSKSYSVTQTQFSVGRDSHPTFVSSADFNSDQHLDIVVTKTNIDSIGIMIGFGNGSFYPEISYTFESQSSPTCLCIGDFNNDGRSDLAVSNYGTHNIGILLGLGDGTFTNMTTYPTGNQSFPIYVVNGDFNNDHILDIAAANFRIDNVAIFLGYGNGRFTNAVTYSTGKNSDPSAIFVADFNSDNQTDLAIANSGTGNVGILFGKGNGSFQSIITYSTGFQSHPDSIICGYIDNDTYLDIVIADSSSDNIAILYGSENGTYGTAVSYTDITFSNPSGLALGDVNYDNYLDIIITNFGTDNVGILTGYNNRSFSLGRSYPLTIGSNPKGVALGDFNNNTRWDIFIAESGIGTINYLVRYISADFQNILTYSTGISTHPYAVIIADFNNDNISDVLSVNSAIDTVGIFLGYGNGTFTAETMFSVGQGSHPVYAAVADFNQDNILDIATANSYNDSISIIYGFGNGSFTNLTKYSLDIDSQPNSIAICDLNNDNVFDFIIAEMGRDSIGILLGYEYNAFEDQITYSNEFSLKPSSIISRDFNNDSYLDIAATFAANDSIGILFGYNNGTFRELIMYSVGYNSYPYEIVSADVNNDNILDIIVANAGSSTIGVLLGLNNEIFAPVMLFSTGNNSSPYGGAAGDFNNDKNIDFVVANYLGNNIGVLLGYGNGSFAAVVTYSTEDGSRPQSVAIGDFNEDNILDIVVANYRLNNIGIFLGRSDGTFANQITYSTGYNSMPAFIIVNDFNNDNKSDVVICNTDTDDIGIFYGYGNGTFTSVMLYSTGDGTSPHAIRSGDFNNDNSMDIVVASPGTNRILILYGSGSGQFLVGPTFSTGSKAGTISLAVGDFDGNGLLDVTTANYLGNNIGVHISSGIQHFGRETIYPTGSGSAPYAVGISDFNHDNQSDVVVANYGTNNIGIFFGFGNGTLSTIVLYSMENNAHPTAVAIADLNHDNNSDIAVVNSGSNNIYIFLGSVNGIFSLVTIYSTGLNSYPYGITIADFNNDNILDIIAAVAGANEVILVQGYGNGTFGNATSYTMGYNFRPNAVAVGYFNGDNWLDIAVANYGADYIEILLKTC